MVTLGDLRGKTEHEIKEHLAYQYGIGWETDEVVVECLKNLNILIAYESVGDWGCDSTSYFLLKDKISDNERNYSDSLEKVSNSINSFLEKIN